MNILSLVLPAGYNVTSLHYSANQSLLPSPSTDTFTEIYKYEYGPKFLSST